MTSQNRNGLSNNGIAWFVFGAVLGATVAVLLAPQAGERTRRKIADQATVGRKNLFESTQEVFERGRELFERGREIAQEASEMFERGRKIAEKRFDERT
jgi:gas vesicle protein